MKQLMTLAALFLVVPPALADEPKSEKDAPKKVSFELLKSKHILVNIKINGKGPYRLVFDTGAPMMLINNKLAKETGVISKNTKSPPFALFGTMGQFSIKEFEMGELKASDVATVVMDHPTVAAMSQMFGQIDGIVGFPFFARYRMTVDYQAKEMTFVPTDFKPSNIMETLMATMLAPPRERSGPKILVPPAQWGFIADKETADDKAGLDVNEVLQGSAADKAGLKIGDRLLTIDGRWTDSVVDLFEAASHIKPGQTVAVKITRAGKDMELKVTPGKGL